MSPSKRNRFDGAPNQHFNETLSEEKDSISVQHPMERRSSRKRGRDKKTNKAASRHGRNKRNRRERSPSSLEKNSRRRPAKRLNSESRREFSSEDDSTRRSKRRLDRSRRRRHRSFSSPTRRDFHSEHGVLGDSLDADHRGMRRGREPFSADRNDRHYLSVRSQQRGREFSSNQHRDYRQWRRRDKEDNCLERTQRRRRHSSSLSRDPQRHRRRRSSRRAEAGRRSYSWSEDEEEARFSRPGRPKNHEVRRRLVRPVGVVNAGVVSDDDEGNREHMMNHTRAQKSPDTDCFEDKGVMRANASPIDRDDSLGHYEGSEGSIIAHRYQVLKEVGLGTFGRVLKCIDFKRRSQWEGQQYNRIRHPRAGHDHHNEVVAIKVVRNIKRYHESSIIEADIIRDINCRGGRGLSHCAIMYDSFSFHGHYCMVFEALGPSLYDYLKKHRYQPFPISCVRHFAQQLLETLEFLHSFHLIHTDLKLENLLLLNHREVLSASGQMIPEDTRIKVIDFGGATYDHEKKSSIINTRQYRAPEVILGLGWSTPSDIWSVGCILIELYQGDLLFATHDNIEHLALMESIVGRFPRRVLKRSKNTSIVEKAFDAKGAHRMGRILSHESVLFVKQSYPLEKMVSVNDRWFLHLLRKLLVLDPEERSTARECLRHL